MIRAGMEAEAERTVYRITEPARLAAALCTIALAHTEAGGADKARAAFGEAIAAARRIRDTYDQSGALAKIANAQVAAGQSDLAIRTAEMILDRQDSLLPELARHLLKRGDRNAMKRLLSPCAEKLAGAYRMCGVLLDAYPKAVEIIADCLDVPRYRT
jgi:hypothetical protein